MNVLECCKIIPVAKVDNIRHLIFDSKVSIILRLEINIKNVPNSFFTLQQNLTYLFKAGDTFFSFLSWIMRLGDLDNSEIIEKSIIKIMVSFLFNF
jgi:hypothetical protein